MEMRFCQNYGGWIGVKKKNVHNVIFWKVLCLSSVLCLLVYGHLGGVVVDVLISQGKVGDLSLARGAPVT